MEKPTVIYICSAGHSGSTLLDMLLGTHSSIFSLGEISHLPKNIALDTVCSCGKQIKNCVFWQLVANDIKQHKSIDILATPYNFDLGYFNAAVVIDKKTHTKFNRLIERFKQGTNYLDLRLSVEVFDKLFQSRRRATINNFLLYETVSRIGKCGFVVDSSKSYIKAVNLYKHDPKKVRIIVLSRDGRGVMQSNIKRGYDRGKSVREWKRFYTRAFPLLKRHIPDEHIFRVKYENLAMQPEVELKNLCNFIGVKFEPEMLNFLSKVHHITNGNDMRFSKSSEIRFDAEWHKNIKSTDAIYFEENAGDLNRDLGY